MRSRLAILSVFLLSSLAAAHHSMSALFDTSTTVDIAGVVTEFEFIAPHAYIFVDVTTDSGEIETWQLETYPPGMLVRKGLTPGTLEPGAVISANGFQAHDARPLMRLLRITMPDGEEQQIQ